MKKKFIKQEKKALKKEWKNLIFNFAFAILTILFVILFYENILLTSILVGIIGIIGLLKWKSWIALIIFIFGGIFGAICEMTAIYYGGVWHYSITNFFNIPLWLFFVWGNTAAFLFETSKEIRKFGVKDKK